MNLHLEEKVNNGCNWLAALVLSFHFINAVISISGISVAVIGVVFFILLINLLNNKIKIYTSAVLITFYAIFAFLISFFRTPEDITYTKEYFLSFIVFCVVSLVVGSQRIDIKSVIRNVLWIGAIGLPLCIVRGFGHLDDSGKMGFTYAVFPILCCAIIALIVFKDKKRILALLEIALAMYALVSIAPRGFWLGLAFFVFCLVSYKLIAGKMAQKMLFLIIFIIIVVLITQYTHEIITWANDTIKNVFGVTISALEKYQKFYDRDNVLNGRDELWDAGVSYINESAIFGKGIGFFESKHGGQYTHNIILQSLCEMGILFFIPVVILLYYLVKYLFFDKNKLNYEAYSFRAMLVACGCFILFFSSVYWIWVPFWYMVGFILQTRKESKIANPVPKEPTDKV